MRRRLIGPSLARAAVLMAIVAAVASFVRADDAAKELSASPAPGRRIIKIKSGGYDRVAQVHIPRGYQAGAKPALVLMFHGAGGTGAAALDKDGWAAKADSEGFVVVAPEGLPVMPGLAGKFFTNPQLWNSGQLKAGSTRAAIDDVAFVKQLLDELAVKLPYDKDRVYCAGHSNGGGMAFRVAAELSERIAAIGTMAGLMSIADPKLKRPVPTMYIVGTKDPLMPIAGGEVKLPWGSRHNPPVAEPLATWAKALGCETNPKTVSDQGGLKTVEYPSKTGGATLTAIYIDGHGHHWSGGRTDLPESMIGPITNKLDVTDVLWTFFKSYNLQAAK